MFKIFLQKKFLFSLLVITENVQIPFSTKFSLSYFYIIESLKFKVLDFNLFAKKNKELSISKTGRCVTYVSHKNILFVLWYTYVTIFIKT